MKSKTEYTLINKVSPEIKSNRIVTDPGVGGEKLVYDTKFYCYKEINLYFTKIEIPIVRTIKKSQVTFLRPYKTYWSKSKGRIPFHLWGKKDHPLTNVWLEMWTNFTDIKKQSPLVKTQIEDHKLIKFLKGHTEKFIM